MKRNMWRTTMMMMTMMMSGTWRHAGLLITHRNLLLAPGTVQVDHLPHHHHRRYRHRLVVIIDFVVIISPEDTLLGGRNMHFLPVTFSLVGIFANSIAIIVVIVIVITIVNVTFSLIGVFVLCVIAIMIKRQDHNFDYDDHDQWSSTINIIIIR